MGLPGWLITVQPAYGGTPLTGLTDGTGWVRFNMLTPGEYLIYETLQPGWLPVDPPNGLYKITLEATGTCPVLTFYNEQSDCP